jgi:hypothetical protein
MSVVVRVGIPRELRERMRRLGDVNWSDIIRRSIEETMPRYEFEEVVRRVEEDLRDVPELLPGTVSRWIRVDREGH